MKWLSFGIGLAIGLLLAGLILADVYIASAADEPYCAEDLNHDHYIDIFDISTETGHYNEQVPVGSPYDLAPVPPDGYVDVIHDITHLTGMYGQECYGSHGATQGTASFSTSQGEAVATVQTNITCIWASANRPIRPAATGTTIWLTYAIQAWCYASVQSDPTDVQTTCIAQVEENDPPDPQWYLVASSNGQTSYSWCTVINTSVVPRYEMLRVRACWQVRYYGQLVVDDCRGEEFPFMVF